MALEGFKRRVLGSIGLLKGKRKVEEDTVKDLSKSLRRALLEADFNVRQAKELTERVERGILEEEPRPGAGPDLDVVHFEPRQCFAFDAEVPLRGCAAAGFAAIRLLATSAAAHRPGALPHGSAAIGKT